MKKIKSVWECFASAALITGALFASGCTTNGKIVTPIVADQQNVPVAVVVDTNVPVAIAPQPRPRNSVITNQGRIGNPTVVDKNGSVAVESATRLLNVEIKLRDDPKSDRFEADVSKAIEGVLADKRFSMDAKTPDIVVALGTELVLLDKSGSYFRYNGKADVRVERSHDARLLGQKVIEVSGDRKLTESEAELGVSRKLGAAVAQWVIGVCAPLQTELAANDITIKRRAPSLKTDDPDYVKKFVDRVGSLGGILSCRLVQQDNDARSMVFRVVYYRNLFPEGLLNKLTLIKDLQIRPTK